MNDMGHDNLKPRSNGSTLFDIDAIVRRAPVIDMHTHLFAPQFKAMYLSGIDELLTYHYLVAELFRSCPVSPDRFWSMTKSEQAQLVWETLFQENTPVSEATRGVVTILNSFGIDVARTPLDDIRAFFRDQDPSEHLDRVFELAGVESVVMTNDPFDADEMKEWDRRGEIDPRFHPSLRMDRLLNSWSRTRDFLSSIGRSVNTNVDSTTIKDIRTYIDERISDLRPLYLAASVPDDFRYPADDHRTRFLREVILPTAREHDLPVVLMVGVRRGVNPTLRDAGDGVGQGDVSSLERLCLENLDVRFFATYLSRENQHELCVAARKFSNLMPFGCWWFLNNPSIIAEITSQRLELLGTTFVPQHSDARVLEQLIYKWQHSRGVIAQCLSDSYDRLIAVGGSVSEKQVQRDVTKLFETNFTSWVGIPGRLPRVSAADAAHLADAIHLT